MKIMVVNSGSSSLKYSLYNMDTAGDKIMAKGICERIGIDGFLRHDVPGSPEVKLELPLPTHRQALEAVFRCLTSKEHGVLEDIGEVDAVGHRIGHGGNYFSDSVLIDEQVKEGIQACIPLVPLHNPPALTGIDACTSLLGDSIPQVAVFDTAFHQSLPPHAYTYSLPKALCKKHNIRRYGFHGTSHQYVARQAAALLGKSLDTLDLITCHLGNGSSMAAIKQGKSIDTTMGFAAVEGLIMGTRCGDIDPVLSMYLMQQEGLSPQEVESIYYKESGLLGISGVSSDLREVEDAAANGDPDAQKAVDVLCYGIKKYIGAYLAALGGLDAVVFTAGIGENSPLVRRQSLAGLEHLGILLDKEKNETIHGESAAISQPQSPVSVFVIPTDEEWMIASDTMRLVAERHVSAS